MAGSKSLSKRLWDRVEKGAPDACWPFMGATTPWGYGRIGSGLRLGHAIAAHRAAYEDKVGPIPEGIWVLHRCDNPPCCNPKHLFLGTVLDNVRDMDQKGRRRSVSRPGTKNPCARLSESQVKEIMRRREGGEILRTIAADYSVTMGLICSITKGRVWNTLSGLPKIRTTMNRRK